VTAFQDTLKSEFIPNTNNLILTEDLRYWCARTQRAYIVPAGFISDCASIPRVLWPIIGHPFDARWRKEAVLHDWLYRQEDKIVSRKTADQMFYDGLRLNGLRYTKAQAMYMGVRIGGARAWKEGQ